MLQGTPEEMAWYKRLIADKLIGARYKVWKSYSAAKATHEDKNPNRKFKPDIQMLMDASLLQANSRFEVEVFSLENGGARGAP